jgi:hypothetical protein
MANVPIERKVLVILLESLEDFWGDHTFAQTESNPSWVRDRDAMNAARRALGRKEQ